MTKVMEYWRPWFWGHADKYYVVKLSQLRLKFGPTLDAANDKIIAIQIKGTATKKGKVSSSSSTSKSFLIPFHRTQKLGSTHTTTFPHRFTNSKAPTIVWDARDLCDFHLVLKHGTCYMTLHVLHAEGDIGEYKSEMVVVGEVSMSVTMAEFMEGEEMKNESNSCQVQRTLPIQLKVHGLFMEEATLSVSLSLLKLRNFHDDLPRAFVNKVTSLEDKNNGKVVDQVEEPSPYEWDELSVYDSDDSSDKSTTTTTSSSSSSSTSTAIHCEGSSVTNGSERFVASDSETLLDTMQRSWSMLPWNRSFKGWSFKRTSSRKQEPLTSHSSHSMGPYFDHNKCSASGWETRELRSRDAQAMLKTNVFFASFDQRSKQACGESACTALAVCIAHWLHSNHNMPTRSQFDSLIKRGSSEWRRLSHSDHYLKLFPDKHFDLETVLEANIRPLVVTPQNSYTGFFSPEKFQCLEGAMSFDDIWDEITRNDDVVDHEPRIYIVSWNDHFFVLKVEVDACYVIDTLGERLFEGCRKAFILKFDGSSLMHAKGSKKERGEIVCKGKECCKEFIKRFLAAIPLRQLEEEERNKGTVYNPYFHRKLQIDLHYSLLSSLSSASSIGEPL
ncbi:hypothetical protein AAZX31_14G112800 [Glycine max]|uniref:C2 NT-type domain-containing protein n=2 Tax=Glycine subgen. Soja TaxID=1462606 RepID=I1M9J0_SOYBN|nr:uncharacterized protein LOC100787458 [Glycine max]XP_028199132.1 uncharacterized protein LOC114383624 [Glycine soja]KAG4962893.1 hypothetical protein JHK86_039761 [Glycine max]KAG4965363.1 hypothetical protein JHK85_040338 [Glycine max]KAG5110350.1 hypothetical protein JHK82_039573 [Glycine max]KAG5121635.1 hypothetical protein JHK84_039975 [Glycine max]KAH1094185.1 hypothetical protein GYH30_039754 [Glycine max]|eukprot:XP_003545469.1 uncharacterized protein LOC100787458 [Glycine max]